MFQCISEMGQGREVITKDGQLELICALLNGAISSDPDYPKPLHYAHFPHFVSCFISL